MKRGENRAVVSPHSIGTHPARSIPMRTCWRSLCALWAYRSTGWQRTSACRNGALVKLPKASVQSRPTRRCVSAGTSAWGHGSGSTCNPVTIFRARKRHSTAGWRKGNRRYRLATQQGTSSAVARPAELFSTPIQRAAHRQPPTTQESKSSHLWPEKTGQAISIGWLIVWRQQINPIRRFFSNAKIPDSVITHPSKENPK